MKKNNILSGLYPITSSEYKSDLDFISIIKDITSSKINIFQFRPGNLSFKRKKFLIQSIHNECQKNNVKFIINNDYELLKYIDGAGLHIGHKDVDIKFARKYLGKERIIGVSCYNSIEKAKWAQENGADYISLGAIYISKTKKNALICDIETIHNIKKSINIPICVIGGINCYNITKVLGFNPHMIAMISGIYDSPNPKLELNHLIEMIRYYEKIKSAV
ncbi:MAG: thiamine phosphate synthase [Gammaproteobacteria bacterium]|nr:thiamine phosphate synthase [Gammaproteobacteria bacterium]|tara:strand:- start:32541 stop:33197 length:657 start_codon:yes stop_codon:yes gene_type:complete